jgi:hydrogenase maturation factor
MNPGKLPAALLSRLLATLPLHPSVLLGPGIGRDAAAIDLGDGRVLVAASDPVTFATDRIGSYAVHVNANDVACLGAQPSYFLATVLLPDNATEGLATAILEDIRQACQMMGVACIGGHTEITVGLDRPVVAGTMLGETRAELLVRPDAARASDHLLMTKGIAIEGTALLARDAAGVLLSRGASAELVARASSLLDDPGISIVREALIARDVTVNGERAVRAMHDVTEGGLATALLELGEAAGLAVRVHIEDVTLIPETKRICQALDLDPLGLLASGALLVAVTASSCDAARDAMTRADISVACIGELAEGEGGDIIGPQGSRSLPRFERDELARFLDSPEATAEG